MLLAIPLSYQNPRRSRTINLVMAVLIYLTYSNLLNVVQSWIEQGKLSFGVGIVGLHVIVGGARRRSSSGCACATGRSSSCRR